MAGKLNDGASREGLDITTRRHMSAGDMVIAGIYSIIDGDCLSKASSSTSRPRREYA